MTRTVAELTQQVTRETGTAFWREQASVISTPLTLNLLRGTWISAGDSCSSAGWFLSSVPLFCYRCCSGEFLGWIAEGQGADMGSVREHAHSS